MSDRPVNVLFSCPHNSARSILAEAVLNPIGKGRFKAFSASLGKLMLQYSARELAGS